MIVGDGNTDKTGNSAFRWSAGTMVDLGSLPGFRSSYPNGVSNSGAVIAGSAWGWSGERNQAVYWNTFGITDLDGEINFLSSDANGISANGVYIIGYRERSDFTFSGFRWSPASGFHDFNSPDASGPRAISDDGSVVVGSGSSGAFKWTSSSGVEVLPGVSSYASDVTGDGRIIVGSSEGLATMWTASGARITLGALPGDSASYASGISADGSVIVGTSGSSRAFRITKLVDVEVDDAANEKDHNTDSYTFADVLDDRTIVRRGHKPGEGGTLDVDVLVAEGMDDSQFELSFEATHEFEGQSPVGREIQF
ncbi:MAG: hypothetical protein K8E66_00395, partial [Phycisphaerales bacterium]|nr:hypothetical protein [Phycisphaerales bacterium]